MPLQKTKNALSHGGIWTPHLTYGSLGPHESVPIDISIGSAVFAGLTGVPNTEAHGLRNVRCL